MVLLVTFSCYGSHLPGDSQGSSITCAMSSVGSCGLMPPDWSRNGEHACDGQRTTIEPAIRGCGARRRVQVCEFRGWFLYALHVRTNHLHGIVEADEPRRALNDWKAYATRALRAAASAGADQRVWAHAGSTRRIAAPAGLEHAIRYVLQRQGEPMETFRSVPRPDGRG
jgi:hypothetical protein